MGGLMQTLRNLGPARLGLMGAVMVGMLVFFFFLTSRMSTGQMALLYNDLPTSDAGAITAKLDALQVPFTVSADGSQIKVPADQVGKLRMTLAGDGLPSGGGVGYEIFDKQNGFGTTSFVQNINQVRALEGELARTISSLQGVKAARVHLVLPYHELFAKETEPSTASVFLTLKNSNAMGREQIAAVQHLVAAAVPGLKPNAISIIDNNGNLLARGGDDGGDQSLIGGMTADENRHNYEARVVRDIEDLLGRTVGFGKVRATVTADLDFDRVTTSQEKYDPEGQVARSTQTVSDKNTSSEGGSGGAVSVANNLPESKSSASGAGGNATSGDRTEETTNYEVGKTVISSVKEIGQVKKMSVAVLIDGTYSAPDKDGKTAYAPRSPEEIKKLEDLVKSAIGFDEKRGDSVKLENMQFARDEEAAPEKALPLGLNKDDLGKMLETVILGLVAILFILLVVRPLTTKVMAAPAGGGGGGGSGGFAPPSSGNLLTDQSGGGGMGQLSGPGGGYEVDASRALGVESEIDRMINLEQVEGRVRASSLKKVSEIVDKHPEQAVGILRNWLYQDPNR